MKKRDKAPNNRGQGVGYTLRKSRLTTVKRQNPLRAFLGGKTAERPSGKAKQGKLEKAGGGGEKSIRCLRERQSFVRSDLNGLVPHAKKELWRLGRGSLKVVPTLARGRTVEYMSNCKVPGKRGKSAHDTSWPSQWGDGMGSKGSEKRIRMGKCERNVKVLAVLLTGKSYGNHARLSGRGGNQRRGGKRKLLGREPRNAEC